MSSLFQPEGQCLSLNPRSLQINGLLFQLLSQFAECSKNLIGEIVMTGAGRTKRAPSPAQNLKQHCSENGQKVKR